MSDSLNIPTMLLKKNLRINTPGKYMPRRLMQDSSDMENDPPSSIVSPSKFAMVRNLNRLRHPLEDHDPNSQDSGISEDSKSSEFRFLEPSGAAPRRMSSMDISPRPHYDVSPRRVPHSPKSLISPRRSLCFSSFASSDSAVSLESNDDTFMDLFSADKIIDDENAQMPGSSKLGSLLSARILSTPPKSPPNRMKQSPLKLRCAFRRAISENVTPNNKNTDSDDSFTLKRPLNMDRTPLSKRHRPLSELQVENHERGTLFQYGFKVMSPADSLASALPSPPMSITPSPPSQSPSHTSKLPSSISDSELSIKFALGREEDLIGDFSRPFALPVMLGKHHDLKTISCETLANLINGNYGQSVSSFNIIDCRYPYEFEGGHIKGAVNLHTREQVTQELMGCKSSLPLENSRHVLVFHCEFSRQRGPCLSRWLRKEDRAENTYPQLSYPEIYLLDGGYSAFFANFPDLCEPRSYKRMDDPEHVSDLKHFRAKSKSWAGNHHKKITMRNLSRLGN